MRPYQAPVNTAAVSYTVIWALWNVEVARPINPCESFYLSIPPPPLSNVGRKALGGRTKSVSGQEAEFN